MVEKIDLIIRILYLVLVLGVLFLPRRYALLSWILSAHLDLSGSEWASASAIGWENALRIVALPTVLLVRMGFKRTMQSCLRIRAFYIFLLFSMYIALASLWSSYHISAVKQVGYMYAYLVGFAVLLLAWNTNILSPGIVWYGILGSVVLGFLKMLSEVSIEGRFTSFTSPQSYAEFLAAAMIVFFYSPQLAPLKRVAYAALTMLLVLLSGSRIGLIGTIIGLMVTLLCFLMRRRVKWWLLGYIGLFLLTTVLFGAFYAFTTSQGLYFRALDMIGVLKGETELYEIGTFGFRLGMWNTALLLLRGFGAQEYIFGRGTSSSAEVALLFSARYDPATVDANRVMHNEFLRILYEWGIVGCAFFCTFILSLVVAIVSFFNRRDYVAGFSLLSFLPMLVLSLSTENILAASGGAGGIGFLIILAFVASRHVGCEKLSLLK